MNITEIARTIRVVPLLQKLFLLDLFLHYLQKVKKSLLTLVPLDCLFHCASLLNPKDAIMLSNQVTSLVPNIVDANCRKQVEIAEVCKDCCRLSSLMC